MKVQAMCTGWPLPRAGRLGLAMRCATLLWLGHGAALAASSGHAAWPSGVPPEAERLQSAAQGDVPVAVSSRIAEAGGATRLTFDLSAKVAATAFLLDKPDRVIIDLPEVNFQMAPEAGRLAPGGVGIVRSFRFGLFAPGRSRIVIDLAAPATLRKASVDAIADGAPSRLTIELIRSDRAAFKAAVHRDQPPAPPPATVVAQAAAADPKPVIVIDPGHGGIDPGASGADGTTEKFVVFDFANMLASKLSAMGRYKVVLTRGDDSFVSLSDRVRLARDSGAALLISVHADTLSDASVTGATVYTAADRASDAEAARVAASENQADEAAGLDALPETPGVSDILFDLTRRETRTYAHLFQRTLVGYWQKTARLNRNPERAAGFKVLQAPDVPSVLLELGYLSSDKDRKSLTSPEWRDKATGAVAASIDSFFAKRAVPDGNAISAPSPTIGGSDKVVSAQSHP